MRVRSLFCCLLLVPFAAASGAPQVPNEPDLLESAITRITEYALQHEAGYELLADLCATAPHRLSGSPGEAIAVAWAEEALIASGLANVRLEPVTVPRWKRGRVEELRIIFERLGLTNRLSVLALGGSAPTPEEGVEAEVLLVKSLQELKVKKEEAKGKIVFFNRPMDRTQLSTGRAYGGAVDQRTRGPALASRLGAVACVVRSMTTRIDDTPHTGVTIFPDGTAPIPAVAVSTRGAEKLSAELWSEPGLRLRLRLDCRTLEPVKTYNVIGELVGRSKPEEIVLLGAHLDAWDVGQGAHDDGAGVVHAIQAVRIMKQLDLRPRRTIRVVLFANEENGLAGGRTYAQDHAEELARHVFAIESDAGGFTPRGFGTNANEEAFQELTRIAAKLEPIGAGGMWHGGGGADIGPMKRHGVILCGFRPDTARYFDLHHSANDTLDAVNPRELALGTAAIASLAYAVAEMEEALPRNPLEEKGR